jgi:hypothetical protein
MRLPGKETKQGHSQTVGNGMRHTETAWQRKHVTGVAHMLLMSKWDSLGFTCRK